MLQSRLKLSQNIQGHNVKHMSSKLINASYAGIWQNFLNLNGKKYN